MNVVSHQTVQLSRGKHASPEHGACVMELASMLAGERFSDHPRSVCPALGAVLRAYNDWLPDERRQDLYAYAARSVGTRRTRAVMRRRVREAFDFLAENSGRRTPLSARLHRLLPTSGLSVLAQATAGYARATNDASHARMLGLLDRMIAIETADATPQVVDSPVATRVARADGVAPSSG